MFLLIKIECHIIKFSIKWPPYQISLTLIFMDLDPDLFILAWGLSSFNEHVLCSRHHPRHRELQHWSKSSFMYCIR